MSDDVRTEKVEELIQAAAEGFASVDGARPLELFAAAASLVVRLSLAMVPDVGSSRTVVSQTMEQYFSQAENGPLQ